MRVEPHSLDSIVHVIKRGTRGLPIVRDEADRKRFVRLLYYANDQYRDYFWETNTATLGEFGRPDRWPEQEPIVKILAWSLMPNHFHLVLKDLTENGISKFMQQLCGSMSMHFNKKYKEKGSIFQGAYKGRTANSRGDEYLKLLAVYVMVKNPFELYPGGLKQAIKNFDKAFDWARCYPYCSLGAYTDGFSAPVLNKDIFGEIFDNSEDFKAFAKESLLYKLDQLESLESSRSDLLDLV